MKVGHGLWIGLVALDGCIGVSTAGWACLSLAWIVSDCCEDPAAGDRFVAIGGEANGATGVVGQQRLAERSWLAVFCETAPLVEGTCALRLCLPISRARLVG